MSGGRWLRAVAVGVAAAVLALVVLGPIYWIVLSSFRPNRELLSAQIALWPQTLTLGNYRTLLDESVFARNLRNSAVVTFWTLAFTLVLAVLASYALRRFEFPAKRALQRSMLLVYLFPTVVLLTPLYWLMAQLKLINSHWSLVLVYVAFTAPFSVWLIETFFHAVPRDVEEAAVMESAGRLRILFDIYLPLIAPGLVSAGAFTVVYAWSEYMFAVTFLNDRRAMTLPLSLDLFTSVVRIDWGVVAAGATLAALPVVVALGLFGSVFLRNMTRGALK